MVNPFLPAATDQYQNVLVNTGRDEHYDRTHDQHGNLIASTRAHTPTSTHNYDDGMNHSTADPYGSGYGAKEISPGGSQDKEYVGEKHTSEGMKAIDVELDERAQAVKLMRTATWINTFFLLTTDILGPSNAPYSIASMGYVPGCLMYFFFGGKVNLCLNLATHSCCDNANTSVGLLFNPTVAAAYTGMVLLRLYLHYDTEQRPLQTYGDISERVFAHYGPRWAKAARIYTAFFQALQLLLNVAVIILGSAQAMYQMAFSNVCFVALAVAFTGAGFLLGFIKQLKNISHLANLCIWINIFICIATLGISATTPPLTNINNAAPSSLFSAGYVPYDPATGEGLVPATGVAFNSLPLEALLSGVGNMVYAYGGATIFIELIAEMKQPRDFWKSWVCALFIIMGVYFSYGVALYSMQGPYVGNPGNQGISQYGWQTALNALNLFTGLVAAVMYGNVGMKVIYITVGQELLNAPALTTRKGSIIWCLFATVFWWLAFILAESIPQFSAFTSIVSAICIMQFTYVLPALLQLLFESQQDRTWKETFTRKIWLKAFDFVMFTGSIALMGLILWASVEVLISALQQGTQQFGCTY